MAAAIMAPIGLPMLVPEFRRASAPGLLPQTDEDIVTCWTPVIKTHGCITQMYESLCKNAFSSIGPACCRAITDIKQTCWPRMFPFHPDFPPLVRGHCADFLGFGKPETSG
ncbi:hypothetical protein Vadar_029052 [Vaccinium darrowii]|uniref:Uncharacterized protein n=1 Tax=Vaccinium darrowii TaxID=229202 RepID=A0ACB7Z8E0_9ERIC|nr:hypothetical protein Vadar_029052 [Vaccinium darrowii]